MQLTFRTAPRDSHDLFTASAGHYIVGREVTVTTETGQRPAKVVDSHVDADGFLCVTLDVEGDEPLWKDSIAGYSIDPKESLLPEVRRFLDAQDEEERL